MDLLTRFHRYMWARRVGRAAAARAPKMFTPGETLVAVKGFTANCHVEWGISGDSFEVAIPKDTEVIYCGPSFYADFDISFTEPVFARLRETFFASRDWILKIPRETYTFEVTSQEPQKILAKKSGSA